MKRITVSEPAGMGGAAVTKAPASRKTSSGYPEARGLYDPRNEHDACGVGFIAHMKGEKSHKIISDGLAMLENLTHRGAVGADPLMGDGAGMLVQIPDALFRAEWADKCVELPPVGDYAVGHFFLPQEEDLRAHIEDIIAQVIAEEGKELIGFRDVPVDNSSLSKAPEIVATEPVHRQVFIAKADDKEGGDAFERRLFILRKVISSRIHAETDGRDNGFYPVSMSSRTIVYKGMFLAYQVGATQFHGHDTGLFAFYLATDPAQLRLAEEELLTEIAKLAEHGVPDEAFERVRATVLSATAIDQQSPASIARHAAIDLLFGLPATHHRELTAVYQALTPAAVQEAARGLLGTRGPCVVRVSP